MRSLSLICLLAIAGLAVAEQPAAAPEPVVDPPGRVARLSYTEGEVSVAPAGTEEWAEAVVNRPLTSGDRVWVDRGGRAELQVGSATIDLDQGSGLSIVNLDDDVLHLTLTEGTATVRVNRKRDDESIGIDTPNATVTLLRPGEYHIEANSAGDQTIVGTRSGESEVAAGQKSWRIGSNEEGTFNGTGELAADIHGLGPRTAFEDWANDRNRGSESSVSSRYVSNEVIGYEDLDRHGYWVNEPAYGYVWQPTYVAAGWAPYRYGRWVWVSPWGWSWVDNAPWGFAPFHYGRWAYLDSRWCWVPGPRYVRPVYAPALVAWSTGPAVSVSTSFGSGIGWFPLGPREVYVPGYYYSRRYLNNINVSNTVIVNNTYITNIYNGRGRNFDYRFARDPHAVTVVARDRFIGGLPLDGHLAHVPANDLRRLHPDPRPPALAPNRDSVFASRVLGRIPGRVRNNDDDDTQGVDRQPTPRDGVVRNDLTTRGRISRVPFDVERNAIVANGGRPVGRNQLITTTPRANAQPNPQVSPQPNSQTAPSRSGDAWRIQRDPSRAEARNTTRGEVATESLSNDDAANARSFADRPASAQQPDRAQRAFGNEDRGSENRMQIPEQRTWSRGNDESARRARESMPSSAPSANALQEQPRSNVSEPAAGQTSRQWRNDDRPARVERSAEPRSYSEPRSYNPPAVERQQAPARSWQQPSNQAQPQPYRAPQPRVEQPRNDSPPPARQPRADSGSSDRTPRSNNNSNNGNGSGSRQDWRKVQ